MSRTAFLRTSAAGTVVAARGFGAGSSRRYVIGSDPVRAELGAVLAGVKEGREPRDEIRLFKSAGVAVQDLAAADKVLAGAQRLGLGTELRL